METTEIADQIFATLDDGEITDDTLRLAAKLVSTLPREKVEELQQFFEALLQRSRHNSQE